MAITRKLEQVLKLIKEDVNNVRNDFLTLMADNLVDLTNDYSNGPAIDTGAYVSSHSITETKGSGRGRSSRNKPSLADPKSAAQSARDALYADISGLTPDSTNIYMNNHSPHSQAVERGGGGWLRPGYWIYTRTKREAGNFLKAAVIMNRK